MEVVFDIDANGIVNVSAKDKATNKLQSIVIASSGGLSEEDVQRMVNDAEKYKEADSMRKSLIEAKNDADSVSDVANYIGFGDCSNRNAGDVSPAGRSCQGVQQRQSF